MAYLIDRGELLKTLYEDCKCMNSHFLAAVRHAPAVSRWIPVEDALPEQGERVIVAIFGSDMIMPNEGETLQDAIERSRKEGYITVGFIGSDGWYGADGFPLMVRPSYWMPKTDLHELPKE